MVSGIGSNSSSISMQQLMAAMMSKMSAADTDGTEGLSKSELSSITAGDDKGGANFLNTLSKNFDKIDSDGNGQLSANEIKAARPSRGQMGPPPGLGLDSTESTDSTSSTDSTNSTSSTDSTNLMEALFKKLLKALEDSFEKSVESASTDGTNSSNTDAVSSTNSDSSAKKLDLSAADTDGVSGLSKTELSSVDTSSDPKATGFLNELSKNFDKIDTNGDGQLSTDEINAAKPHHGHHHTASQTTAQATTDTSSSANSQSSSNGNSSSNGSSTLTNLSEYLLKQLLSSYKDNISNVSSALNLAV